MPKTDNQKANRLVSCYMTDAEFEELGRECEELVKDVPGARMTRSAFLIAMYRQHLRDKSPVKES